MPVGGLERPFRDIHAAHKMNKILIHCCGCGCDVYARLTNGGEIYPHRPDLAGLPFWRCDGCGNFVGCHHKTSDRTKPLGCIPTPAIKDARKRIHAMLDPIWRSGKMSRMAIYKAISKELGWEYHTAKLRSVDEADKVLDIVRRYTYGVNIHTTPNPVPSLHR